MKQEPLFDLIKSLTGHEKRYFKIFQKKHSSINKHGYLRIFEAIEQSSEYDENLVKKQLEPHLKPNSFVVEKNYLFNQIIKSLNLFHAKNQTVSKLKEQLQSIQILFNKTMYRQALKITKSAKKIAIKNEQFRILIELLNWEIRIHTIVSMNDNKTFDAELLVKKKKEAQLIDLNVTDFQELKQRLGSEIIKSGNITTPEREKRINNLLDLPILASEKKALSREAKMRFHEIRAIAFYMLKKWKKCYTHFKKEIAFIEELPVYLAENELHYLNSLNNFIFTCGYLNKRTEQEHAIEKIKQLEKNVKNKDLFYRIFATRSILEMNYCLHYEVFDRMPLLAHKIDIELTQYAEKITGIRKQVLDYNLICLYMHSSQPKDALKWINTILNQPVKMIRKEIFTAAKILNLIVHYEMENWDLLEYESKNMERSINKKKSVYALEKVFVEFINAMIKEGKKERIKSLVKLKQEIIRLAKDPYENQSVKLFTFEKWIDKQLTKVKNP